jgi:hypothetical protein
VHLFECAPTQTLRKRREQPIAAFEQDDAHRGRQAREVARHDVLAQFAEHARKLDARGPAAHQHEAEQRFALVGVLRLRRALQAFEHVVAQRDRLVDVMQREGEARRSVAEELGGAAAASTSTS